MTLVQIGPGAYVNPEHVTAVRANGGAGTRVHLSSGGWQDVAASVERVVNKLRWDDEEL